MGGGVALRSSTMPTYRYAVEIQGTADHIRTTPGGFIISVSLGWPDVRAEELHLNTSGLALLENMSVFISRSKDAHLLLPTAFDYQISPDESLVSTPPLDSPSASSSKDRGAVQLGSSDVSPKQAGPTGETRPMEAGARKLV